MRPFISTPRTPAFLAVRGLIYYEQDDLDKAITDFTAALKLDPENVEALLGRAQAYCDNDEVEKALADANEALRLDAEDAADLGGPGPGLLRTGQPRQGDRRFHRGAEGQRGKRRGLATKAYCDKDDLDKALADANEAVRLDAEDAVALATRGLICYGQHSLDKAIADYSGAIKLTGQ